jgi:hypothetical protein
VAFVLTNKGGGSQICSAGSKISFKSALVRMLKRAHRYRSDRQRRPSRIFIRGVPETAEPQSTLDSSAAFSGRS